MTEPSDAGQDREVLVQGRGAGRGDLVRLAALVGGQGADQPLCLEAGQRAVQGPWAQLDTGELADILNECVAVLWATGQAGQDEDGRLGVPPSGQRVCRHDVLPSARSTTT